MSRIVGGFRRSLSRDGFHEIHDDHGLVLKSTLKVVDEVVDLARANGLNLHDALLELLSTPGWYRKMCESEYVHRRVWEGHSRESAQAEWDNAWAIAERYR